jgi:two-component system, cell cycle sensor histidine kinase and response regulator CckA
MEQFQIAFQLGSILFQSAALLVSGLLWYRSCKHPSVIVLIGALCMMLTRRSLHFYQFLKGVDSGFWVEDLLVFGVSVLMLVSLLYLGRIFQHWRASERDLQRLSSSLEQQVQERTASLEHSYRVIEKTKKQWERTFDAVPDLIMILDTDFRIVQANKAVADALGRTVKELKGRHCYKVMHRQKLPPAFCPNVRMHETLKSTVAQSHNTVMDADVLIHTHPILTESGKLAGSVHVMRDITELKYIQKQLELKHEALLKAEKDKMEDLLEASRALNGGIAHELRTPLQAIMNSLEIVQEGLQQGGIDDFGFSLEELIQDAIDRVFYSIRILESLSAYAKAGVSHDQQLINVMDSLGVVRRTLLFTDKFKHLTEDQFRIESEFTDLQIWINPSDFIQVMTNLCKNAVESITHPNPELVITVSRNVFINIHIVDNGCGIPEELGDDIFQPYVSTKGSYKTQNQGLGLSIVRRIVLAAGGHISYRSRPGFTDFCLEFKEAKNGQEEE